MIASREIDWLPWRGPATEAGVRCSPQCLRHNSKTGGLSYVWFGALGSADFFAVHCPNESGCKVLLHSQPLSVSVAISPRITKAALQLYSLAIITQ